MGLYRRQRLRAGIVKENMIMDPLTVALPKGRLLEPAAELFRRQGWRCDLGNGSRQLLVTEGKPAAPRARPPRARSAFCWSSPRTSRFMSNMARPTWASSVRTCCGRAVATCTNRCSSISDVAGWCWRGCPRSGNATFAWRQACAWRPSIPGWRAPTFNSRDCPWRSSR